MKHAIMRNFGGLKSEEVDPFNEFYLQLNMPEEELNPDYFDDVEEVAKAFGFFCTFIICLYLNRYGQSLIRIAQGLV